ncbi:MAG: alpha/beta fold hydrolase [Candidatus Promineifilaceae bacterium]|nr:alpha/beta fold hydrolase [Candidatus Promineifilaceae bacterium]
MQLFCFPYAGGSVPAFRSWGERLPDIEVWIAHLPGRGSRIREDAFTRMLPLVQALTRCLPQTSGRPQPFAFFGHSLGARLGFEVARTLRRQNRPLPVQLLISACPAPQVPPENPSIHAWPKAAFLAELQRRSGLPTEVTSVQELLDLLLPMLRADFAVFETAVYQREAPLDCSISVFGGHDDPVVSQEALLAWEEQTTGSFQATILPGDHFFMKTAEAQLLQHIGRLLAP